MERHIVKVIFDDQTEISVGEIKTRDQIKETYNYEKKWEIERHYARQFKQIERSILDEMDYDVVRDYAIDYLDLVDEDDCDCDDKTIDDFEDEEIMCELQSRNLIGPINTDIITTDLFIRFSKLLSTVNPQELETIISNLENK